MPKTSKIRLFVENKLEEGLKTEFNDEQRRYLINVMRLGNEDKILLFNGYDGEYEAKLEINGKKQVFAEVIKKSRDFALCPDIWLLFAPLKKDRTDFVVEKATELGVRKIMPVIMRYGISDHIKINRWRAQSIEAAEQSRRLDIPQISPPQELGAVLASWDEKRKLYYMDETLQGNNIAEAFSSAHAPAAILVGPEGGFAATELDLLAKCPFARSVTLGKRILRAETAVAASLACWQALSGDWR
ncbi:MAG: 16S rRNA (uracil(1498)-N(3))-methyltransferase [Alphaproteobacteria bacterium]|nr:16S rRNA (uracil(1498)-N(3))-methyltransferase [Alphaproteobacteria bacterium]